MSYYGSYAKEDEDQKEFERLKAQRLRRNAQHEDMQLLAAEEQARKARLDNGLQAARKASAGEGTSENKAQ